jgi:two-component system nitrate/nitrite response regulator NarL
MAISSEHRPRPSSRGVGGVSQPIRVVLADGHPIILDSLAALLSEQRDFEVVARCQDGQETLRAVRAQRPDLLILDLRMPGRDGLQVLRELRAERNQSRAVLLVNRIDDEQLLEATRLGARGVVLKDMAPPLLVGCLRRVHAGELWIERNALVRAFAKLLQRESSTREISDLLSRRALEIALMAARGMRNKAIGEALHISEGTVKTHLHLIYKKLGVRSRLALAIYLTEKGVL